MNQSEFRAYFAAALAKRYPEVSIQPAEDTYLELSSPTGAHGRVNTAFPYSEYVNDPATREAIVERYAASLGAAFPSRPFEAAENLFVMIDSSSMTAQADGLVQPLGGDVAAFLALRVDRLMRTATTGDLAKLGLSDAEAWERAKTNMAALEPLKSGKLASDGNADGVLGADAFARLVTDPSICASKDPRVFLMLAPGAYAFGDPRDPSSMRRFKTLVEGIATKPKAMSRTPVTCASGSWQIAAP